MSSADTKFTRHTHLRGFKYCFESSHESVLADALEKALGCLGLTELVYDQGSMWGYRPKTGLFEELPPEYLRQIVLSFHGMWMKPSEPGEPPPTLSLTLGQAINAVNRLVTTVNNLGFFDRAPQGITFQDCFVRVSSEGCDQTGHSSRNRARQGYDFPFPADTTAPLYDAFNAEIFKGDPEAEEKINVLEQFDGACIIGAAYEFERAILLRGKGDNGKTRRFRLSEQKLPGRKAVSLSPHLWKDQYAIGKLAGASLNYVGEMPNESELAGSRFKGVVSGEPQHARYPGGMPFTFLPRAGHLISVNPEELPKVRDTSHGFRRRWIVINFGRSFTNDPIRDPFIVTRIIEQERPAMVRRALDAAVDLLRRKEYGPLPTSHEMWLDDWLRQNDVTGYWARDCTRPTVDGESNTASRELYSHCVRWAEARKIAKPTETAFGKRMLQLYARIENSGGNEYACLIRGGS